MNPRICEFLLAALCAANAISPRLSTRPPRGFLGEAVTLIGGRYFINPAAAVAIQVVGSRARRQCVPAHYCCRCCTAHKFCGVIFSTRAGIPFDYCYAQAHFKLTPGEDARETTNMAASAFDSTDGKTLATTPSPIALFQRR